MLLVIINILYKHIYKNLATLYFCVSSSLTSLLCEASRQTGNSHKRTYRELLRNVTSSRFLQGNVSRSDNTGSNDFQYSKQQRKPYRRFCLAFVFAFISFLNIQAANYPIQLTTQLVPPFSGYVSDYASTGNENLRLFLLLTDGTKPLYNVKLQIRIEGQGIVIQSKSNYFAGPYTLEYGLVSQLSGNDLVPLLNEDKLDFSGISRDDYDKRKTLPEGFYKICVTAYDYNNPVPIQVSEQSCAYGWITLNDPPRLNMPECGKPITIQDPQQITFAWTPMHMSSPNSFNNTEYEFSLYEIRPDNQQADNIVQSIPPVYQTTTTQTILNYGISETPLIPGMRYAWRVRAIDLSGRDAFKNKGYSQTCTFTWGSKYQGMGDALNITISGKSVNPRQLKCTWDSLPVFSTYAFEYRKAGDANYWFPVSTGNARTRVINLEPENEYEVRVKGITPDGYEGPWSNMPKIKTPALPTTNCGEAVLTNPVLNKNPLKGATVSMIWELGNGFEMIVQKLENNTSPLGIYSGIGRIQNDWAMAAVPVKFTNIQVNEEMQLFPNVGSIWAISKPLESWVQENLNHANDESATYYQGKIDSVKVENGVITIYPGPKTQKADASGKTTVRDEQGNEYTVYPDGKIEQRSYITPGADSLDNSAGVMANFKASANQQYGFDAKEVNEWYEQYEHLKTGGKELYAVANKSILQGKTDVVNCELVTNKSIKEKDLSFVNAQGATLRSTVKSSNSYEVTVSDMDGAVYALYKGKRIGKLNIYALKPINKKLVLVALNNASTPSASDAQNAINKIYAQAGVTWSVTIKPAFSFDLGANGLDAADATLLSKYSDEMRNIRDAYLKATSDYDKDAYYLFVVDKFSDPNQQGYMVRNKAYGFILLQPTPPPSGEAGWGHSHELAHGAFGLEHTFPKPEKGSTTNLLDYNKGTQLTKKQWNAIQNNISSPNWFDQEGDGELKLLSCSDFDASEKWFIAPNGKTFKMPKGVKNIVSCVDLKGAVGSFELSGKIYTADYSILPQPNGIFNGYKNSGTKYNLTYALDALIAYAVIDDQGKRYIYNIGKYLSNANSKDNTLEGFEPIILENLTPICSNPITSQKGNSSENTFDKLLSSINSVKPNADLYVFKNNKLLKYKPGSPAQEITYTSTQLIELKKIIKSGEFSSESAVLFEYGADNNFKTTIGFNKSIAPAAGYDDAGDAKSRSSELLENKVNSFLSGKTDLAANIAGESTSTLEDGRAIEIQLASVWKTVLNVVHQGKEILVNAKLPEQTWNSQNAEYKNCWLKMPPLVAGIGDGVIENVKDIPVLVAYGAELTLNKESRIKTIEALMKLSWDKIKTGVKAAAKEWVNTYAQKNEKSYHQGGKDAVMAYGLALGGAKLLLGSVKEGVENKVDDIAEAVERKVDDVLENIIVRGVSKKNFFNSVPEFAVNTRLAEEAYDLWKNEKWEELEGLFAKSNINSFKGNIYPPCEGFININETKLLVNYEFDRYGGELINGKFVDGGKYISPKGTLFDSRALPKDAIEKPYKKYKVIKEIPTVIEGEAIPWFGAGGKGVQQKLPYGIDFLKANGYIIEIQ